jgi:two-component system phosphate regulon sensor histidine kinase PhoR
MVARTVPLGRWVRLSVAASFPIALAFLVLYVFDLVSPVAAALSWAGLSLIATVFLRVVLADLGALKRLVETAAEEAGSADPIHAPRGLLTGDLAASIERLARVYVETSGRLESDRAELERVLNAVPEPLLLLGAERQVLRASHAARELLGEDGVGRDIATSLRNPALISAIEQTTGGGGSREIEFTLQTPVERTFAARIEPLPEPGHDGAVALVALVDLTAVRRTEQMRADFVANASHEIRTPLSTLTGFIETLQGPARDDPEARDRFLAIMDQHAKRMARLVDDLLSLSRIEMNEHTPPTGEVPVLALLNHVCNTLSWQAEQREVTVSVDVDDGLPPVVGDSDELTQVFLNLVDNAIKYGNANSTVRVRARRVMEAPGAIGWRVADEGAVAVSITDQGAGIRREHLPRLTERFYRVDTARSRELGGTGLGLAIVKHIVNRHRGALAIDSVPDEGSTFSVYLQPAESPRQIAPRDAA